MGQPQESDSSWRAAQRADPRSRREVDTEEMAFGRAALAWKEGTTSRIWSLRYDECNRSNNKSCTQPTPDIKGRAEGKVCPTPRTKHTYLSTY